MVGHNRIVIRVNAVVGVLGMNSGSTTLHPEGLDLLVLKVVVEMHVAAEDVLYRTAVVGLVDDGVNIVPFPLGLYLSPSEPTSLRLPLEPAALRKPVVMPLHLSKSD